MHLIQCQNREEKYQTDVSILKWLNKKYFKSQNKKMIVLVAFSRKTVDQNIDTR